MTTGLMLVPQPYGYHGPSYAYVENLRTLGFDMHFGGCTLQLQPDAQNNSITYAHHLYQNAGGLAYASYAARLIEALQPDFVHALHYRGAGLTRLFAKAPRNMKWFIEVRTVHVESRNQTVTRRLSYKDRITWAETLLYDEVIANTDTIKRRMTPSRRPIALFPTGASWDQFNRPDAKHQREKIRHELQLSDDAAAIIYAGTLSQSRNLDKLISAFAEVASTNQNVHLLLVGGSANVLPEDDPGRKKLFQQVIALGLQKNVHFIGRVPYVDVPNYYAAADIGFSYMPPETAHETQWPTKLIEIMMSGLIPVTNITIGAREVYQRDDAVVACGSKVSDIATAFRRAIALLSPDAEAQRKQLISNARSRSKQLDWKEIITTYLLPVYASSGIVP
jgi:glycosyltransferase involved in cell wall biosynthesis